MDKKKLSLKKETISRLSNQNMENLRGGLAAVTQKSEPSSQHTFTCCWCSFGASEMKPCN
jgi:hypothetical protein